MKGMLLHASCVAVQGQGVLLLGDSGTGKSDLALRLIDTGAQLVADDQVSISLHNDALIASPPKALTGLLEVRGAGLFRLPFLPECPLAAAIQLCTRERVERLPEKMHQFDCLNKNLPLLSLPAFDASTPAKIRLFLSACCGNGGIQRMEP